MASKPHSVIVRTPLGGSIELAAGMVLVERYGGPYDGSYIVLPRHWFPRGEIWESLLPCNLRRNVRAGFAHLYVARRPIELCDRTLTIYYRGVVPIASGAECDGV